MASRVVIMFAVFAVTMLVLGTFTVPNWAKVAFVVVLLPGAVITSRNRIHQENRIARTFWQMLRRKPSN
jgi:hypothetical protein